ncbi:MAG: ATP-binding protein [Cyclobacteriaceae bacterium]|nr:ATP-binding protein [Cyclobacteriaceae bacterium]
MKLVKRHIYGEALDNARQFRAVCIVGPRQSGKTTLSQMIFGEKPYFNFEDPDVEAEARQTKSFLQSLKEGAVLDEVQRVPTLFRYLQGRLDASSKRGQFILTGSNNFLLQEQIAQSLAGRVGYLELLPLSYAELKAAKMDGTVAQHIFTGGYPEIWQQKLSVSKWMAAYFQTYVQRDVRLIRNINNLPAFTRFVRLCAGYAGQIINKDALAKSTGVDAKTVQAWLGILESSYIIYLLQPYYENLNKRIVKSPKLYFCDTGLLCYLLGFTSQRAMLNSTKYGALFENWVITEIRKNRFNKGIAGGMYYFRDSAGNEVDLILEKDDRTLAVEVKAGKQFKSDMLGGVRYWLKYNRTGSGILITGSDRAIESKIDESIAILSWQEVIDV